MDESPERLVARLTRSSFAVLDQGLYSSANFLVNILLARWLSGAEYGAFTVAFSIMLVITAAHSALLIEPMLVFGASKYEQRFSAYFRLLIDGHFLVAIAAGIICALAAAVLRLAGSTAVAGTLAGLAMATPFLLLAALARRAFYVVGKPGWSAIGSAIYLCFVVGGIYAVNRLGVLYGVTSMAVLGFSGALAGLAMLTVLRPRSNPGLRRKLTREVLGDHWRYGRWAIGCSLLSSSSAAIYYLIVTAFLTLESVALLRAFQNLFSPISQVILSITWFLVPQCVKRTQRLGPGCLTGDAFRISAGLTVAALLYLVMMLIAGPALANLLYARKYTSQPWLIANIALAQVITALGSGVYVALRASGRSDLVLASSAAGVFLAILANLVLIALWGFYGASAGIVLFPLTASIAAWWLWQLKGRSQ